MAIVLLRRARLLQSRVPLRTGEAVVQGGQGPRSRRHIRIREGGRASPYDRDTPADGIYPGHTATELLCEEIRDSRCGGEKEVRPYPFEGRAFQSSGARGAEDRGSVIH